MQLKTCIAAFCLILCLAVSAASLDDPYKIYDEARFGGGAGNAYYFGGVFDGTAYVGHIGHGAQQWGDEQKFGTGCLNATDSILPLSPNNVAKAALPLGGWIYMSNGAGNLCRVRNWGDAVMPQELPSPVLVGGVPVYCDCITTDGTYIYVSTGTGAATHPYNTIYKYSVDHEAGTLSLVWQSAPAGSTTSTHRFRALSYWNGKLYTANNKGATVGHIFEIDCATGAFTDIATMDPTGIAGDPYQVARYGNQMFAVSLTDELYTFNYSAGAWTQESHVGLGIGDLYGIAVTGTNGTTAKYAWITHIGGAVTLWDLDPQWTTKSLGDARMTKNGHPSIVNNVVVIKHGVGGFWVEDKDRAAGAYVNYGDVAKTPVVGNLCTIKGGMTDNNAGESVFNALEVTDNGLAPQPIKPVYLNNKNMINSTDSVGLATDGMLVKVTGKVNLYIEIRPEPEPPIAHVYIDDGSGCATDREGITGVKVVATDWLATVGFENVQFGTAKAEVTGIVRYERLGNGTIIKKIEGLTDGDIVFSAL